MCQIVHLAQLPLLLGPLQEIDNPSSHQHWCNIKGFVCLAQGATQQACGHMYLDGGEELDLGTSRDHMLAFSAFTAPTVSQVMLQECSIKTCLRFLASLSFQGVQSGVHEEF